MKGYVVSINGRFVRPGAAKVSVFDHGFLFGDSVYEVVRTVGGQLFAAKQHLARLHASAAAIELRVPRKDDWLLRHLAAMHRRKPRTESYLRLIVTRGEGQLELHPQSCKRPAVIGIAKPLPQWDDEHYAHGCKIVLAGVRRNLKQATDPAVKSGNYLNNVLALMEARREDAAEALMVNAQGLLTECTTSNIFLVKAGVVRTPALEHGLLQGVTRGFVLELCRKLGLPAEEAALTPDDLFAADEVFITSTTRDVMPVGHIGKHKVKLTPGRFTLRIANAFHDVLHDPANLT
ncbi:MAG: aminotransferase class IV [Planctomycetes bacterium]|nr:aminotransferase class IV [Planctomycetota bacterium]MCL4730875.1 aminotransferase class IV [Planctomycetota bacterium]